MSDMPYALETVLRLACGLIVLSSALLSTFAGIKLLRAEDDKARIRGARKLLVVSGAIGFAAVLIFLSLGTVFDFFYKPTGDFFSTTPGIPGQYPHDISVGGYLGIYAGKAVLCYDPIGDDSSDAPIPDTLNLNINEQPIPNSHEWIYMKATAEEPGYCTEIKRSNSR